MSQPARHTLAIVGGGPIGLEAAAFALELGLDVHVFERGEPGAHALAWGHVAMFTPWSANVGPASARLLARHGWTAPDPNAFPTGAELAERYLAPLAACPELRERVHAHAQVVAIARRGLRAGEHAGDDARASQPFRLLVRDAGGRENFLHAFAVIDASGVYGSPNWAGTGGIPARGESYVAPQLSYRCDDVAGLRRAKHAGRRTLVIGDGLCAATTVTALAALADEVPETTVVWATRRTAPPLAGEHAHDPLAPRAALFAAARALQQGGHASVAWFGGGEAEDFEFNSATHRYRVAFDVSGTKRVEEADEVVVDAGFGPDTAIFRELHADLCWATHAPRRLGEVIAGANTLEAIAEAAADPARLAHPEPGFWILGAKSFGRRDGFLLATGYAQAGAVLPLVAAAAGSVPTA